MIGEIRLYADGVSGGVSPELRQNASRSLGIDLTDRSAATGLANDLTRIRDNLVSKERENFKIDENNITSHAYVYRFLPVIYLGESFFYGTRNISGASHLVDTKHAILIHESTHFRNVLNTRDLERTYGGSEALARDNPNRARRNAMNWELFFTNYAIRR
jgi:hypothetical protein